MKILKKILLLPVKLLTLPLILVVTTLSILVKLIEKLSSGLIGLLLLFLLYCAAVVIWNGNWYQLIPLGLIASAGVAVILGAALIEELIDGADRALIRFLRS